MYECLELTADLPFAEDPDSVRLRAEVFLELAETEMGLGSLEQERRYIEEAVELASANAVDPLMHGYVLRSYGSVLYSMGDLAAALVALNDSIGILRAVELDSHSAPVLINALDAAAKCHAIQRNLGRALELSEEARRDR